MPCGARIEPLVALSLAAGLALSGCATSLPAPGPANASVNGQVPAGGLPHVARIVANELPINLVGFWNDPKEREEFEKRRAAIIAQRAEAGAAETGAATGGVLYVSLFACAAVGPFCLLGLPVAAAVGATGLAATMIGAGQGVDYIPITEANSQRLHALYSGTLTGVALGERTLRLAQAGAAPADAAAEFPRLELTMKSATVRKDERGELHLKVVAEAQAQPAPGATWAPTEHVIDMEFRQHHDYTVTVQRIIDVLAQSIVATYLPHHPFSAEQRLWDDAEKKDAARVQAYLDRYPQGAYAQPARARLAKLAAERAAADSLNDEPSVRAYFAQLARVHPGLEGSWSGSAPVPFCIATSYAIRIENGNVEGTVQWQLGAAVREQVLGYVKDDGTVFVVPVASGRVDRSRTLNLSLDGGRLSGASNITCASLQHRVSLRRD